MLSPVDRHDPFGVRIYITILETKAKEGYEHLREDELPPIVWGSLEMPDISCVRGTDDCLQIVAT